MPMRLTPTPLPLRVMPSVTAPIRKVAHVFALVAYDSDYGEHALARRRFDNATSFSMIDLFEQSNDGLAHGTPRPLVDWPRSPTIDIDDANAGICGATEACAAMNAHVATAFHDLSTLAGRLGMALEEAKYASAARAVATTIFANLTGRGAECEPAAEACVLDNLKRNSSVVHSTIFPLALDHALVPGSPPRESYLAFLRARYYHGDNVTARASPWATGFMLRGLLGMALESSNVTAVLDAADFAHEVLTSRGPHSWIAMMDRHNATMTMEAWSAASGSGTMSHPWNAAPAEVIPRHLMGLRPLEPAFRRVLMAPVFSRRLQHAALRVPTLGGVFELNVTLSSLRATADVAIPGNSQAQVCLPMYAVSGAERMDTAHQLTVDGKGVVVIRRGSTLCTDVGPGRHAVVGTLKPTAHLTPNIRDPCITYNKTQCAAVSPPLGFECCGTACNDGCKGPPICQECPRVAVGLPLQDTAMTSSNKQ